MLAAVLELVADEANSVQVGAHRELGVLGLGSARACAPLGERLVVEREGEHDEASDLACVKLVAVEAALMV